MFALKLLAAALLIASLCYAAISDFRHMIVPNWVCGLIALGFAIHAAANWPAIDLQMHLLIAGLFFGIALVFWFAGWLGGGDVKLLGATGLWLGTDSALAFLFILAVISTIVAGGLLLVRRTMRSRDLDGTSPAIRPVLQMARNGTFPYAVPIVFAALATLPRTVF
ncbi:MAG: A24 family peptidase [Aestuariivirgaceae bacterium]